MGFGKIKRRLNRIRDESSAEKRAEKDYLREHPEIKNPARYKLAASLCPDYDRRKPFTLENAHKHVEWEDRGCPRCKTFIKSQEVS